MARLPVPGDDVGSWGDLLNEFLLESHTTAGVLKNNSVNSAQLAPGSVTSSALATGAISASAITNGTVNGAKIANDAITDSHIATDAAISQSKIVNLPANLASKENTVANGTTGQYYRGDKSWQSLNKSAVGLTNVDDTADLSKPISTATQSALNLKLNAPTTPSSTALVTIGPGGSANTTPLATYRGGRYLGSMKLNVSGATQAVTAVGDLTFSEQMTIILADEILVELGGTIYISNATNSQDFRVELSNDNWITKFVLDPYNAAYPSWAIVASKFRVPVDSAYTTYQLPSYILRIPAGTWKFKFTKASGTATSTFAEQAGYIYAVTLGE